MDPFNEVYQDASKQLSLLKITSPQSLEFSNFKNELIEILKDLEISIEVVNQSKLRALNGNGNDSFPEITKNELDSRNGKILDLKNEFNEILKNTKNLGGKYNENPFDDSNAYEDNRGDINDNEGNTDNVDSKAYREYHQQLLQEQDELISNELTKSINNLHQQAVTIGDELDYHTSLIDQVEEGVDRLNFKIVNTGLKRINKFLQTNELGGNCCIAILIVVLIIILVLLIIA